MASPDLILAIETSNPSAWTPERRARPGVALGRLDTPGALETLGVEPIALDDPHTDDLMSAVERLFRRASVRPAQLARVAVSVGPGGYTAVRVAVVTAKMLALSTGAECIAVPSADVVARRVGGACAVCLASKGDECFVTRFGPDGVALGPGEIADAGTLTWGGFDVLVGDRFVPGPIRARAAELGVAVEEPEFDPAACLELGSVRAGISPHDILPIYPRIPEAVRKWRELGRSGPHN